MDLHEIHPPPTIPYGGDCHRWRNRGGGAPEDIFIEDQILQGE